MDPHIVESYWQQAQLVQQAQCIQLQVCPMFARISFSLDHQSRTQSPLPGFLVSGWAPVETLGNSKKSKFFDWLPCNDFHCFTAEILR